MLSKIRGGILSCIGLIIVYLLKGIIQIPSLVLDHFVIYNIIIQIGFLWFSISLWMVLKYDLVKLNNLTDFEKPITWLIRNLALVAGLGLVLIIFPIREMYFIFIILGLILTVNYIIVFVRFYRLEKDDLEYVADLHNYVIAMIIIIIALFIVYTLNELLWQIDIKYLFDFIMVIPILFLLRFLIREKKILSIN